VIGPPPTTAHAAHAHAAPAHAAPAYAANPIAAPAYAANALTAPAYAANALIAQAATTHAATDHANPAHAATTFPLAPEVGGSRDGMHLLEGRDQRADLTTTTIDLLQAMTDWLANGSASAQSTTKNYDCVELEYLFQRIGAPQIDGSFTGLGAESLPEFFQSLATARGEKANTRLFVERYRSMHYPRGAIEYDFVWTTPVGQGPQVVVLRRR
jgi:hypothetical protein